MYKPEYGNPIITIRLEKWQINGLKMIAREKGTTVSEILREYVTAYLAEHGITNA